MTNNKQQTAVEWLIEKCACADLRPELWEIIKQQANAMHKEEIIDAANKLLYHGTGPGNTAAEQYYNETYENEQ